MKYSKYIIFNMSAFAEIKKSHVLVSWMLIILAAVITHRILLDSEKDKTNSSTVKTEKPIFQNQNSRAGNLENNTRLSGVELIRKADPKVYSSSGEEAPIYHEKSRLSDPAYKEKYLRHKALHLYENSAAKNTEGFKDITKLLKDYGYDEELVFQFYNLVYLYSDQKEKVKEQTFNSVWAGQPETPEKLDVYDRMIELRQDHRKQMFKKMLSKVTGIENQNLLDEAFEIHLTHPFGIRGIPEPAEGERLIQNIK